MERGDPRKDHEGPRVRANWVETEELMQVPDKERWAPKVQRNDSSSSSHPAKTTEFYEMAEGNEDSQYGDSQYILD